MDAPSSYARKKERKKEKKEGKSQMWGNGSCQSCQRDLGNIFGPSMLKKL
jgi:hypothetical protein